MNISASSVNLFPNQAEAALDDLTIVRIRGELLLQQVSATAESDGFEVGFGICIVTQNAAGIGVSAVPAPIADIGWDGWMVHWHGQLIATAALSGGSNVPGATARLPIDSKAMRKLHLTDTVVAVLEVVENPTSVMQASFFGRMLSKLP